MSAADSAGARRVGAINTPGAGLREEAALDSAYIAVQHPVLLSACPA